MQWMNTETGAVPAGRGSSKKPAATVSVHARDILGSSLVYPVISRRSGGLSIGINLFPDRKLCTFDCPYCEVFPSDGYAPGDPDDRDSVPIRLERDLDEFFTTFYPLSFGSEPIRDLCVSGDGEPTVSPYLGACLEILESFRTRHHESLGDVPIVVITNSTGFLKRETCELLENFRARGRLDIWAKLDAGSAAVFGIMSGSSFRFDDIVSGLLAFSRRTPVILQSMLCSVGDFSPDVAEIRARAELLAKLVGNGALIREVHLYTLARPACHPGVRALEDGAMLEASRLFSSILPASIRVRTFGPRGSLS